jgi:hypothetical protein
MREPCALTEAGYQKIFTEQISGAVTDRPALQEALAFARSGDTLIVWKLDRLARSMKQLIETIEELRLRGVGFHLVAWIRQESSKIRYLWRLTDSEVSSSFSGLAYPCNKVAARRTARGMGPGLRGDDLALDAGQELLTLGHSQAQGGQIRESSGRAIRMTSVLRSAPAAPMLTSFTIQATLSPLTDQRAGKYPLGPAPPISRQSRQALRSAPER